MDCAMCDKCVYSSDGDILCPKHMAEAYRHNPELYAKITLVGGGTYVQPLDQLAAALNGEIDGAEEGDSWTITLIKMSQAEYEELPEFPGH